MRTALFGTLLATCLAAMPLTSKPANALALTAPAGMAAAADALSETQKVTYGYGWGYRPWRPYYRPYYGYRPYYRPYGYGYGYYRPYSYGYGYYRPYYRPAYYGGYYRPYYGYRPAYYGPRFYGGYRGYGYGGFYRARWY